MTVNATPPLSDVQTADGTNRAWVFPFKITAADQIALHVLNGTESLITEGYTVSGVNNESGGIVTYPIAPAVPLANGTQVIVSRMMDFEQPDRLSNQGPYHPQVHENAFDRLAMQIQQIAEIANRAVVSSIWSEAPGPETSPPPVLPPPDPGAAIVWGPGGVLENSTFDVGEFDTALINAQAAAEIATGMAAQATDAAAVAVTATTGLASVVEFTSVEKFRTTGLSDHDTVVAAIASCFATGEWLYWPDRLYTLTTTIPNFHKVRHYGSGRVTRSTDTFTMSPTPGTTNRLYVASTGSATNDGLTVGSSMRNIQNAFDALANYGPVLEGTWIIQFSSGTYSAAGDLNVTFVKQRSRKPVIVSGPTVAYPGVPTTIISGTTGNGWKFEGDMDLELRYLKFQGFTAGSALVLDDKTRATLNNVHTFNCLAGVEILRLSEVSYSGILDGNLLALSAGLSVKRGRVTFDSADFRRNAIAVRAQEGAAVLAGTIYSFNNATANENTENYRVQGSSLNLVTTGVQAQQWLVENRQTLAFSLTGTLTETFVAGHLWSKDRNPNAVGAANLARTIRISAAGNKTGALGVYHVLVRLHTVASSAGGTLIGGVTQVTLTAGRWHMVATIDMPSEAVQSSHSEMQHDNVVSQTGNHSTAFDLHDGLDHYFNLTAALGNIGDTITVDKFMVETLG